MSIPLGKAEEALSRGDYAQCIQILEYLENCHEHSDLDHSNIRMLLITAYIGKGDNHKAIKVYRLLVKSKTKSIREQAKQLLPILEAPSLNRPSNWSIQIPSIKNSFDNSSKYLTQSKPISKNESRVYYPPTGETKNLSIGFLFLIIIVLTILTFIL